MARRNQGTAEEIVAVEAEGMVVTGAAATEAVGDSVEVTAVVMAEVDMVVTGATRWEEEVTIEKTEETGHTKDSHGHHSSPGVRGREGGLIYTLICIPFITNASHVLLLICLVWRSG